MEIRYHIFTDGYDEWAKEPEEAIAIFQHLIEDGCSNIRLYKEEYSDTENDEPDKEDCLLAIGNFPQ